jgi:predicted Rdx family selenoprotein
MSEVTLVTRSQIPKAEQTKLDEFLEPILKATAAEGSVEEQERAILTKEAKKAQSKIMRHFMGAIKKASSESTITTHLDSVSFLFYLGYININAEIKRNTGDTMLHTACRYFKLDIVRWLVENKASPNVANNQGMTPAHVLCKEDKQANGADILSILNHNGANFDKEDFQGVTVWERSRERGYAEEDISRQRSPRKTVSPSKSFQPSPSSPSKSISRRQSSRMLLNSRGKKIERS